MKIRPIPFQKFVRTIDTESDESCPNQRPNTNTNVLYKISAGDRKHTKHRNLEKNTNAPWGALHHTTKKDVKQNATHAWTSHKIKLAKAWFVSNASVFEFGTDFGLSNSNRQNFAVPILFANITQYQNMENSLQKVWAPQLRKGKIGSPNWKKQLS